MDGLKARGMGGNLALMCPSVDCTLVAGEAIRRVGTDFGRAIRYPSSCRAKIAALFVRLQPDRPVGRIHHGRTCENWRVRQSRRVRVSACTCPFSAEHAPAANSVTSGPQPERSNKFCRNGRLAGKTPIELSPPSNDQQPTTSTFQGH